MHFKASLTLSNIVFIYRRLFHVLNICVCLFLSKLTEWCVWDAVPGRKEHLGLPRLPNWIVHPDKADLHNLVVSFTASHGPSDEWHPQKIIFLLGCNKSYVKCSTACKAMAEMWQKKMLFLFYSSSNSLFLFCRTLGIMFEGQHEVHVVLPQTQF